MKYYFSVISYAPRSAHPFVSLLPRNSVLLNTLIRVLWELRFGEFA
jgi:hypothetical protein